MEAQPHKNEKIEGEINRVSPLDDDITSWIYVTDKNLLDNELELYDTKWFDYRRLTPLQATRLYMEQFHGIYRRHYAQNFDGAAANEIRVFDVDRTFEGLVSTDRKLNRKARTHFIGCWRRQVADAIGIPYDVYIDLAFTFRLNYWNRATMPFSTHLYNEWVVERVVERWEEMQERKLYLSDDPVYKLVNYQGISYQDSYHEWLMTQAFKRSNPPMFLAQFVNDGLLMMEKVRSRYEDHVIERVERYIQ